MKFVLFSLLLVLTFTSWAKGLETDAMYVVPTANPALVASSRFKIEIVKPYVGYETQKISYKFPEVLVGEAGGRLVELARLPGAKNSWTSDELTAHCAEVDEEFSCNIYLNKERPESLFRNSPKLNLLSLEKALGHLNTMSLPQVQIDQYKEVLDKFYSGEPAGFFTYDFD